MTAFYIEVPAHVQHADQVTNQVQVRGGTNWDLSRTAVETPISKPVDPQPLRPAAPVDAKYTAAPQTEALKTVHFGLNSVVVPAVAQKALKDIPKGATVVVSGHSDAAEKSPALTAEKRAAAVAAQLRKRGVVVEATKAFGAHVPAKNAATSEANRRVEVLVK